MPSKSKKHSKSGSKLSQSDQIPSSPQNSSNLTPNPDSELDEDQVLSNLEGISRKYPSLIGTTAFAGRVNQDAGPLEDSNGCKIWLSPSSMVASSITPGSVVSVSLASSRREISSHSPLSSLVSECARHYGFADEVIGDAGNYFVLATVHPSCKVLKNGVRLSSNLSRSMGYPASGRIILVYPVSYRFAIESVNGIDRTRNGTTHFLSIHNCKDLYLALVSSRSGLMGSSSTSSHFEFLTERNAQIEDGTTSSPKTPSFSQSKFSSPSTSHLNSPRYMKSLSNLNPYPEGFDSFDIKEVLRDESGRNVIQACIASCLCSRHLLCGSLVVIAVLSELCIFQVLGANKIYANKNNNHVKEESSCDLILTDADIMNHVNDGFLVDHATKVHLLSSCGELEAPEKTHLELESRFIGADMAIDFPKLGGLSKEFLVLKDIITSSVKGTLSSFGLRPTKGVLLHGPPGTGKTSLARACAHDAGLNLFTVNGPEIVSQYHGESEQELDRVFKSASQVAPAVVFIDELDAIAPSRKDGGDVLSQTMVATLLDLMDGISRMEGIVVIAATNRPDSIEPALRRPGRLDREIEIGVPSPDQRYDILLTLLREREHSLSDLEIQHLAQTTHGFVGADLAALCNEAAFCCLRRCIDQITKISCDRSLCSEASVFYSGNLNDRFAHGCSENLTEVASGDNCASSSSTSLEFPVLSEIPIGANINGIRMENILSISYKDFEKAKVKVRPSAMREVILEIPRVSWQDIGGQEEVKLHLIEAVEWPQKHQDAFKRIGTSPPTGVLLFGPPGCSKTLLARAVASESGLNFLAVKGPELYSKWVGESEKAVKSLFAKARANAPSIIFFDELDGLAIIRGKENDGSSVADRVMSQLLVELNGLQQRVNVTVIAATNRPDKIDLALLRPGRFDRLVYVGPPNEEDRKKIFNVHLGKRPCSSDVCIEELARMTEGYTGADIALICRRAAIAAIEEHPDAKEIAMKHLKSAIEHVQPSEIESYDELSAKFQRLVSSATSKDDFDSQQYSRRSSWISSWYLRKFIDFCFSLLRGASSQTFSRS